MGFVPTLKTVKFSTAAVGGVAVQPVPSAVASGPKAQSTTSTTSFSPVVSASEASIKSFGAIDFSHGSPVKLLEPSISKVVSLLGKPKAVIPALPSVFNEVKPSYFQHLAPRNVYRPGSSNDLALSSRKFEPYEQLTGISQQRPEIVMLMPFLPLFEDVRSRSQPPNLDIIQSSGINLHMTDAGLFANTQLNVRNLNAVNVIKSLQSLKTNSPTLKTTFQQRVADFNGRLTQLGTLTNFLLDLVKKADVLKNQLDLRDDIFRVQPDRVAHTYSSNFTSSLTKALDSVLQVFIKQYLPPQYDISEMLNRFGYNTDGTRTIYSSTKLWLQLLIEYKQLLENHSLEFLDLEPIAQRNDSSAAVLLKTHPPLFGLALVDPSGIGTINDIVSVQPVDAADVIDAIGQAFVDIYAKGAHFKSDEAKIAALANLLSKEHKFSHGLGQSDIRQTLSQFFSYSVDDTSSAGNLQVFDNVVGKFGNNVSEFPASDLNSLASISQNQPAANIAVLTFESKYLAGNNGTLTPGATYYVDSIFEATNKGFNVTQLKALNQSLNDTYKNFSIVVDGLNMLSSVNANPNDRDKNNIITKIANPADMINYMLDSVVDKNGLTLDSVINDKMCCIYVAASRNVRVKSIMFHFTLNRMLRRYFGGGTGKLPGLPDNTATSDFLISRLVAEIEASAHETRATPITIPGQSNNDYTNNVIRTSMRQGTSLMTLIEGWMVQIYTSLQASVSNVLVKDRLRHSGQLNSVFMMVAFDMIITLIGKYGNQEIVAKHTGGTSKNRSVVYFVSHNNVNHKNSINDVITRLNRELTLVHQATYCVLNVMQKLADATGGFINYLGSPQSTSNLSAVSTIVGDQNLMQLLLSEQQILLLGSTVGDLRSRFKKSVSDTQVAVDRDGVFDTDDEIKILDDSVVSPKLRNAFFGLFGTPEFMGTRAFNKRIITAGIPLGFSRKLKQQVSIAKLKNTSFAAKQNDIVQVVVYKTDLLNQDIIYKPQRFLFELSRFPVRNDAYYKPIPDKVTLPTLAAAIPTWNYETTFNETTAYEYWSSSQQNVHSTKSAFSDDTYSFLSTDDKAEIIKNHLMSHMLEVYIKLLAGINVGDYTFELVESPPLIEEDFTKPLVETKIRQLSDRLGLVRPGARSSTSPDKTTTSSINPSIPTGGVLFSTTTRKVLPTTTAAVQHITQAQPRTSAASGIAGRVSQDAAVGSIKAPPVIRALQSTQPVSTASVLSTMSARNVPVVLHELTALNSFTKMSTSLVDGLAMSKKLLTPKQFDRVFNVVVDPDEFEIDVGKTIATEYGRLALEQMLIRGEIVAAPTSQAERSIRTNLPLTSEMAGVLSRPISQGRLDPNINNYKFRERDRTQGDVLFDKYFVTVETYGEDEV